ncbi:hypothetical protein HT576_14620 [Haloterrigena sp. SYSU A121-1]|uniref:DUF7344 domain-containing protein n=1 Tax=Haloterrigena gelatinilytica TaxID=2741724 RepID=A0A8J8KIG4_9EURY|nr:hypothetical protein [Haloterrigena gelatinilytica]NUB92249.1 hypothetical protein [Haloterrigena gelatinilytica]
MADTASRSGCTDAGHSSRGAEPNDEQSELEPDDIFHILQTSRRRHVLRYLRRAGEPMTLRDLAERIAADEHETTVENLTSDQRQRVYISLYQSHLPKLDTRGIVDYDKDRGIVESTPMAAQFDPYLSGLESESTDPWPRRYAGTVGGCALLAVATAGGLLPIPWFAVSSVVLLAVAAVTAIHWYSELIAS